jgi:hypothetical protein
MLATAGITGALLVGTPLAASATPTVINFSSVVRDDYPALAAYGGLGGVSWAPFADGEGNNAPGIDGATNWKLSTGGWQARNFIVQDDGSGSNNVLWVQKAKAGCADSGITLVKVANGASLITSANKIITVKVKAADANVPVAAILSDVYGGNVLQVNASTGTAGSLNTVTFNFATPTSGNFVSNLSYAKLSLVFDPENAVAGTGTNWGTCGNGAATSKLYMVDDVAYTLGVGAPVSGPDVARKLTFEATDPFGPLAAGDPVDGTKWPGQFEGAGTGVANPPVAKSGKALEFVKPAGSQPWAGVNLFQAPAGQQITSSTYKVLSLDYYNPDIATSPLQVQLEGSATIKVAVDAVRGWNHFDIDMSQAAGWAADAQYTKLVLFPNFKNDGVGPSTSSIVEKTGQKYYIDNVTFNGFALAGKTGTPIKSGLAKVGRILTAGGVTWTGNTVATSFKWYRCTVQGKTVKATAPTSADKCSVISGATASTYTLKTADKNKYIRVAIIGTTAAGSVYALSTSTSKVG